MFLAVLLLMTAVAPLGQDQSAPPRGEFEVSSVKPAENCGSGPRLAFYPARTELTCVTVRSLIAVSYSVFAGNGIARKAKVLGGPSWLDSERYSISAKCETATPLSRMLGPMVQSLLQTRFALAVHIEPKQTPVYLMTVAGDTPKLRRTPEGSCIPMDLEAMASIESAQLDPGVKRCGSGVAYPAVGGRVEEWSGVTMEEFAVRMLSSHMDRFVVDKTGLTGRFDLRVEFMNTNRDMLMSDSGPLSDVAKPPLPEALREQLGLKLTPGTTLLDVIVVDHVEKLVSN